MSEIINNALSINDVSNVLSGATGLTQVSNRVSGTLSSSDLYDWYKFTPTGSGTVNISLAGLSQDADIKLYNTNSLLKVSERGGTASESIQYPVNSGQLYYLAVYNYGKKSTNYTLSV